MNEDSYVVYEKDECPLNNTIGCDNCSLDTEGCCLVGKEIRKEEMNG